MVSKYSIVRRKSLVSDNECSELFRLKKFPIHMLKAFSEQTTLCNDMIFGIDESCGFIQLLETIPKKILYKDSHSNAIGLDFDRIYGILDNDSYKYDWKVSGLVQKITAPSILQDVKSPAVILPESPYKNEIKIQLQQINKNITFL